MIFDTHAHYDDKQFDQDREELLASMKDNGIGTIVDVGSNMETSTWIVEAVTRYPMMYGAVGIHPSDTAELKESDIDTLKKYAAMDRILAIGEIGLDYYWDEPERSIQKKWFEAQIELARDVKLPIIIHSRDAAKDTYDIMNGDMVRQFHLQTPWTYNVSLGYTVGSSLALGAEYEYQDYSSMKFKDQEGYSDTFGYENSTTSMLKGVSTIRLGAEYKVIPQFALRAGYNYTSAIFNSDAYKDLPYNSIQTDTDFANTKALSNYTVGLGYRGAMFYADLAYKFSSYKEDFYPFINAYEDGGQLVIGSPEATKVKNTRSQVLLTLGLRF